jgi:hypothetical protein
MIFASTVAERAILSVDHFLNQAMTYAWMSTLEKRGGYERPSLLSGWRQQPLAEDDYGGGDICTPELEDSTDDDQPLD